MKEGERALGHALTTCLHMLEFRLAIPNLECICYLLSFRTSAPPIHSRYVVRYTSSP